MEMLLSSTIEVAIGQEKKNKQPYSNTRQLFHLSVWPTESSSFFPSRTLTPTPPLHTRQAEHTLSHAGRPQWASHRWNQVGSSVAND